MADTAPAPAQQPAPADPYNVGEALQAGYTPTQIADFLGANRGVNIAEARSAGYSDDAIINHVANLPAAPAAPPPPETSATGAFARAAGEQVAPTAAGFLAAGPAAAVGAEIGGGIGSLAGPIGTGVGGVVGGLAGGLVGFMGGAKAMDAAQEAILSAFPSVRKAIGQDPEQRAADEAAHPYPTMLGGLTPSLLFLRPGAVEKAAENAPAIAKFMANPIAARVFGAGVNTATEALQEEQQGQGYDPVKLGISAATGALLNRETGLGKAVSGAIPAAAGALFRGRPGVPDVLDAGNVDDAIAAAARAAASTSPIDVDAHAATLDAGDGTDQQQAKLLRMFDSTGLGTVVQAPDGSYALHSPDGTATAPIKVWNPDDEPVEGGPPTIPPETAQAIRDHYAAAGIDTVFFQNHPALSFDGVMDPSQPDTVFISNNPQRAVAQIAGHEFSHVLATTTLPDGTNLGDLLNRQIAAGITPAGQAYAEQTFGVTAPQRSALPDGPLFDVAHAAAVQAHLVNELGADIGAEAPRFQSFLPRVIDAIQARFGDTVAGNVLTKLINGLRTAIDNIRSLFPGANKPGEPGRELYGDVGTQSQNWVTNLGDIHDTLAKMYAERLGSPAERAQAMADAARDRAARDAFVANANRLDAGPGMVPAPTLWPVDRLTLRRWMAELTAERDAATTATPQSRLLQQTEAAILRPVGGDESRLPPPQAARLGEVRARLVGLLRARGDTPEMATVRDAIPTAPVAPTAAPTAAGRPARGPVTPFVAVPKEPMRLIDFLRQKRRSGQPGTIHELVRPGGVRDVGGDINAMIGGPRGRPGLINNLDGDHLDSATLRAWDAGYFPEHTERPDINALLDKIREDHTGNPQYSIYDFEAAQAYHDALARNKEIDQLGSEHGIPTHGITNTEFFDRLDDRLSQNEYAEAHAEQAAAKESEWDDFMRLHGYDTPETPFDERYGGPRTLEDIEDEYRSEADPGTVGDRETGDARPGPVPGDAGGGEAGVRPGGRGAGDGGRPSTGAGAPTADDVHAEIVRRLQADPGLMTILRGHGDGSAALATLRQAYGRAIGQFQRNLGNDLPRYAAALNENERRPLDLAVLNEVRGTAPPGAPPGYRQIEANAEGRPLFEDARGVRHYIDDEGLRHTEPVQLRPTRAGMEYVTDRSRHPEFRTATEAAQVAGLRPSTAPVAPEPDDPAHRAKLEAEQAELRRRLPSDYTKWQREGRLNDDQMQMVHRLGAIEQELARLGPPPTPAPPIVLDADGQMAEAVSRMLESGRTNVGLAMSARDLQMAADRIYGGTLAGGAYTRDRLYDAIETGVNRYIQQHAAEFTTAVGAERAKQIAAELAALKDKIPTQTVRAGEKDAYQQFSTPPDYAYAAAWVAHVVPTDSVLEPSAGTGSLFVHAQNAGAREVTANELSAKRRGMLAVLGPTRITAEDAAQIHNILPAEIQPTVVLMNPPFSRAAERMGNRKVLDEGFRHVEQALARLAPGGRLVAIVGDTLGPRGVRQPGLPPSSRAFTDWWARISAQYDARADIRVGREIYQKYGTSFPTRLLVIDKGAPSGRAIITGSAETAAEIIDRLRGVRDDRSTAEQVGSTVEQVAGEPTGAGVAAEGGGIPGTVGELPGATGVVGPGERGGGGGEPAQPEPTVSVGPGGRGGATPEQRPGAGEGGHEVVPGEPQPGPVGAGTEPRPAPSAGGRPGGGRAGGGGGRVRSDGGTSGVTDGSSNTVFTQSAYEAAAQRMRDRLSRLNAGFDPALMADGMVIAGYHIERGLRTFAAYTQGMLDAFGEGIRPYLQHFYRSVRDFPDFDATGMDDDATIAKTFADGGDAGDGVKPDGERVEPGITEAPDNVIKTEAAITEPDNQELTEAVYEPYRPQRITVEGAQPHPGALVQSAAMASVMPPATNYQPRLPRELITSGAVSDAQLEAVIYAGHAHSQMLPGEAGERRAIMVGDGTGVGKGREIAAIILDNWMRGRTKAVWISEKRPLINDARRDWTGIGQAADLLIDHGKLKPGDTITAKKGVLFTSYDTLKSEEKVKTPGKAPKTRVDQIVDWVGKDFDGVIAFDEAHNMSNSMAERGARGTKAAAEKALAGIELQDKLPNARVLLVSATGATEVGNLAYAKRLGLWGEGTEFPNRTAFMRDIQQGGMAAMELIARDMKALGSYIARNLSYDGVDYDRLEHVLTPEQRGLYDKMAEGWQVVLQHFEAALKATSGDVVSGRRRSDINSQFWGGHQRFFNQIITSLQMPSVLRAVEKDLAEGRQAVLQLVNTMEAQQERAIKKARASDAEGDLEDLDMTPRDQLLEMVRNAYPIQQFEDYVEPGSDVVKSRPVLDSEGKPVVNPEMVKARDKLLTELASLRVPDGPLEMLMNHFGTDKVAEVTGRKQRVVRKLDADGKLKMMEEKRGGAANVAEAADFQAGKKRILVFSEAGGTGRSYHAAIGSGSEDARRSHYLVQAGWRADKAVQGFGRTHRTNQASAPIFHLVTTDLQGQKRFISSIARRLGQLGALTKGERRTGDQGLFNMRDNLESAEASAALRQFFRDVHRGNVEGLSVDDLERGMGLKLTDPRTGGLRTDLPDMPKFLNRVLSLTIDRQNLTFDAFAERLDAVIERAAASGTLDTGVETYKADKIAKASEQTVYTEPRTGAETKHVHLEVFNRNQPVSFEDTMRGGNKTGGVRPTQFVRNTRSGNVFAVTPARDYTDAEGNVVSQVRLTSPTDYQYLDRNKLTGTAARPSNWQILSSTDAKPVWDAQFANTPEFHKGDLHLITGAILPIWTRLGGDPKIYRLQTEAGERMLGRVVPNSIVADTLKRLGVSVAGTTVSPAELIQHIMVGGDTAHLANGWRIKPVTVAGERRMEIIGPDYRNDDELARHGVFVERIAYQTRYFIPTGRDASAAIRGITASRPLERVGDTEAGLTPPETGAGGAQFSPRQVDRDAEVRARIAAEDARLATPEARYADRVDRINTVLRTHEGARQIAERQDAQAARMEPSDPAGAAASRRTADAARQTMAESMQLLMRDRAGLRPEDRADLDRLLGVPPEPKGLTHEQTLPPIQFSPRRVPRNAPGQADIFGADPESVRREYAEADAAFNANEPAYQQALAAYRARTIGDADYLAARRTRDALVARFDRAYESVQSLPPEPVARTPAAPTIRDDQRQIDMFGKSNAAVQAQAARDQAGRGALAPKGEQRPADEGLFAPKTPQGGTLFSPRDVDYAAMRREHDAWRSSPEMVAKQRDLDGRRQLWMAANAERDQANWYRGRAAEPETTMEGRLKLLDRAERRDARYEAAAGVARAAGVDPDAPFPRTPDDMQFRSSALDAHTRRGGPQFSPREPVAEVHSDQIAAPGAPDRFEKIREWALQNLRRQKVRSDALGADVTINRVGIEKSLHGAGDDILSAVPAIPDLLAHGQRIGEPTPPRNPIEAKSTKAWHVLGGAVRIDGREVTMFVHVREDTQGHYFYNLGRDEGGADRSGKAVPAAGTVGDSSERSAPDVVLNLGQLPGDQRGPTPGDNVTRTDGKGSVQFSPRITGADRETEAYTPEQIRAYTNVGRVTDEPGLRARMATLTDDLGRRVLRYTLDPYIGVKRDDPAGYLALRNANTTAGAALMFMTDGTLKFRGSTYAMADRNGGVEHSLMRPLQGEQDRFIWWVGANRAEQLSAEDRENRFTPQDIAALKSTNQGQTAFDYTLPNGTVTRSREAIYLDSLRKLDVFNRNALELAVESGLIKREQADVYLRNPFYVPFYREATEGDNRFVGARVSPAMVKQYAYRKLTGGTAALRHDLWQNAFGNWSHMIDASLRNRAATDVLDTAVTNGAAREVTAQEYDHQMTKAEKQSAVWVMKNGERQYYAVNDKMLYTAITALDFNGFNHPIMKAVGAFKKWLTIGVTSNPLFMLRVSIRDAEQAIATAPMSYNVLGNIAKGFRMGDLPGALQNVARAVAGQEMQRSRLSDRAADVIAGGGTMHLGSGVDTGIRKTDLATMLDSPTAIAAFWKRVNIIGTAYHKLTAVGEDVHRFALYDKLIDEGVPHDAASFAARDLEDFTLRGAGTIVRGLTQMVPFMNAWAQGLYKVVRSAVDADRNITTAVGMRVASSATRRVITVLGATTLLTLALDAIYKDDEDYKRRTDADRNANFWFKFGGVQFRIPMGFEIAALSRTAANGVEAFFDKEMTARRFTNNLLQVFANNLSMNPTPQIIKPILDLAMNQTDTGTPIVPKGMETLRPEYQYNANTTLLSRAISSVGSAATRAIAGPQARFLAPVQLDYLTNAYFGWLGSMIAGTADRAAREFAPASVAPARPAMDLWNFATGGMVSTQPQGQSRYVDLLYQQGAAINAAFDTYHNLVNTGRVVEAREFLAENRNLIAQHGRIAALERFEAEQNRLATRVANNPNMSPEQKRVAMMKINAARNRVAEQAFGGARTP